MLRASRCLSFSGASEATGTVQRAQWWHSLAEVTWGMKLSYMNIQRPEKSSNIGLAGSGWLTPSESRDYATGPPGANTWVVLKSLATSSSRGTDWPVLFSPLCINQLDSRPPMANELHSSLCKTKNWCAFGGESTKRIRTLKQGSGS